MNSRVPRPRILHLSPEGIRGEMARMDVHPKGIEIMEGKARHLLVKVEDVDLKAALILKQDMLSLGGDVALPWRAAELDITRTPAIIMGTAAQVLRLAEKIDRQPFGLRDLAEGLRSCLSGLEQPRTFEVRGRNLLEEGRTLIMGVLNVTPDSFSDGGRFQDRDRAVARALEMTGEGADIIDVGGESTRPGADIVDDDEELARVIPVIEELTGRGIKVISVDTTKSAVARRALAAGACIVNDISGMTFDQGMTPLVADTGASAILMHTRGRPAGMQEDLDYTDLLGEVYRYLDDAVSRAVEQGIPRERLCVDPGIGFGKSPEQNMELLARVGELASLGTAVLVGASRKSFIGQFAGGDTDERLEGSIAAASAAVLGGADIVRVHDVSQTVKAVKVLDQVTRWIH